jgi:hypothetical protein
VERNSTLSKQYNVEHSMDRSRTKITFTHDADFGFFCVKLGSDDVPFTIAGNLTLFIDDRVYAELPTLSKESSDYLTSLGSEFVSVEAVEITGDRKRVSREEAKQAIQEFTRKYRRQ